MYVSIVATAVLPYRVNSCSRVANCFKFFQSQCLNGARRLCLSWQGGPGTGCVKQPNSTMEEVNTVEAVCRENG